MTTPPTPSTQEERPFATGPEIGEPLPDFTLPDQHGAPLRLHEARGGERAFLVFIRGTDW
jgi:peroxiredoxin